ncbi:MAG: response regulator [Gemmatimonadales bacterium]
MDRDTLKAADVDILIVDDSSRMRAMIRALLAPLGARVHECTDGDEAVARYDELSPDWVLMDVAMRRLDGIAATRQIRSAHADARVLIVTEHADPALQIAAAEAGAAGYVLKENLFEILDHLEPLSPAR